MVETLSDHIRALESTTDHGQLSYARSRPHTTASQSGRIRFDFPRGRGRFDFPRGRSRGLPTTDHSGRSLNLRLPLALTRS